MAAAQTQVAHGAAGVPLGQLRPGEAENRGQAQGGEALGVVHEPGAADGLATPVAASGRLPPQSEGRGRPPAELVDPARALGHPGSGGGQLVEEGLHLVVGQVGAPRGRLPVAHQGAVGHADSGGVVQDDDGVVGSQQRPVLGRTEGRRPAAVGRGREPDQPGDEPAHQGVTGQQRAPTGAGPGAPAAHGLVQPSRLERADRLGVPAGGAQLLLGGGHVEAVLARTRLGQGPEGLPRGVGQDDPQVGGEPPCELAVPVAQVQQAVGIEAAGGHGPVGQLVGAPAAPLGDLLDQVDGGLLDRAHLVPAGGGLQHGEGLGAPVGGQGRQQGCELGAVLALGALRTAHVAGHRVRQLGTVHAHGQRQQALVGDGRAYEHPAVVAQEAGDVLLHGDGGLLTGALHQPLRLLRRGQVALAGVVLAATRGLGTGAALGLVEAPRVLRDPGVQDVGAQRSGVGRIEPVQVELPQAATTGVLELVGHDHPPAHDRGGDWAPVAPPQGRQGVEVEPVQ